MPMYEFVCRECGAMFEWLAATTDDRPSRCPRCDASTLVRQPSVFAVPTSHARPAPGPCGSADCACRTSAEGS